jgi:chemotaxis regulatin CheY-phosphate phosphatase CheZ
MTQVTTLDDAAYHEIEEAISSTVRGRAYLRMRDYRSSLLATDTVRRISADVTTTLDRRLSGHQAQGDLEGMRRELQELRAHIERSRSEIALIAVKDGGAGSGARIVKATEELYEIVASTERATSDILGAAEAVQEHIGKLGLEGEDQQAIENRCMEIFTACSFQDITGQRIAKVVSTMSYVEQRVASMIAMWGGSGEIEGGVRTCQGVEKDEPVGTEGSKVDPDAHLLNGPQLPGLGLGQDAVDALLRGKAPIAAVPAVAHPVPAAPAPIKSAAPPASSVPKPAPALTPVATATQPKVPAKLKPSPKPAASAVAAALAPAAKLDQSAVDALFD